MKFELFIMWFYKSKTKQEKEAPSKSEVLGKDDSMSEEGEDKKRNEEPKLLKVSDARVAARYANIIIHPWVSEKARLLERDHKYGFIVTPRANKGVVKEVVSAMYGVNPLKVNIISYKSKGRGMGRFRGKTSKRKLAIVTLSEKEKIEISPR